MTKPFRLPVGCFWPSLVVGLLLLVLGILSFAAMGKIWKRSNEVWTEAQGTVDEPYLHESNRSDWTERKRNSRSRSRSSTSKKVWDAKIKYHYVVDGTKHTGDQMLLEEPTSDEDVFAVRKVLEKFPVGSPVTVFYNPEAPERSRLTSKDTPLEFFLDVTFASIFLLLGIGLLVLAKWCRRSLA